MFSTYRRYGEPLTSYDLLKLLAIVTMTVDHLGVYFFADDLWWRALGRASAPIWLFLAGHSRSNRTWPLILIGGLVLLIAHLLFDPRLPVLNILFSIVIARLVVGWIRERGWHETRLPETAAALLFLAPYSIYLFEYGTMGIAIALFGSLMRDGALTRRHGILAIVLWAAYCLLQSISLPYSAPQWLLLWAGNACVFFLLWRFRIFAVAEGRALHQRLVKFLARYSIYYYVIHCVLFMMIASRFF